MCNPFIQELMMLINFISFCKHLHYLHQLAFKNLLDYSKMHSKPFKVFHHYYPIVMFQHFLNLHLHGLRYLIIVRLLFLLYDLLHLLKLDLVQLYFLHLCKSIKDYANQLQMSLNHLHLFWPVCILNFHKVLYFFFQLQLLLDSIKVLLVCLKHRLKITQVTNQQYHYHYRNNHHDLPFLQLKLFYYKDQVLAQKKLHFSNFFLVSCQMPLQYYLMRQYLLPRHYLIHLSEQKYLIIFI